MNRRILLFAAVMIVSTMAYGTIRHVPSQYPTIQAGLNAAAQGDTVLVQPGTYVENLFWTAVSSIKLFSAGDSSNTIIDGDGNSTVLYFPGLGTIDTTAVIRGFRITNGGNVQYGGGIYMTHSSPIVERCLVDSNLAGGGIYCNNSSHAIIRYSRISQNNDGGIIFADTSDGEVVHCGIAGNSNSASYGGSIICLYSSPTFTHVTVSGSIGGGILCYHSSPTFTDVTVSGNTNTGSGIFCYYSSPTFTDVTVSGNTGVGISFSSSSGTFTDVMVSGNTGGGIYCGYSNPTFTDVTVSGNDGGGIYCEGSSPTFTNVTVSGNTGYRGGGIYCDYYSSPTFTDVTVSGNTAEWAGGGIYCDYYSSPNFSEVLVESNFASSYGGGIYCENGSNPSVEHCTISRNIAGIEGDGIYTTDNSWPTISHSNIYLNGTGVYNDDNSQMLDCPNNWWGDVSGPYHPNYNPGGLGDSVNAFVYPLPFLTEPDPTAPPSAVPRHDFPAPATFTLFPNYPNPFNPTTNIAFELPVMSKVSLKVFNILGQEIETLFDKQIMSSGRHKVRFSHPDLSSGVYFYQLSSGQNTAVGKMVLMK